MTFFDLFELIEMVTWYESILRKENQQCIASYGTYQELNYKVDLAKFVGNRPFTCDASARKDSQAQESNRPTIVMKSYSFNLNMADQIFNLLLEAKQIKLVGKYKVSNH